MKELNIVMLHESKVHTVESWTLRGDPDKMRAVYSDFEPRYVYARSFCSHVTLIHVCLPNVGCKSFWPWWSQHTYGSSWTAHR